MAKCADCMFYTHIKYSTNLDVSIGSCHVPLPPWLLRNLTRDGAEQLVNEMNRDIEQGVRADDTCILGKPHANWGS